MIWAHYPNCFQTQNRFEQQLQCADSASPSSPRRVSTLRLPWMRTARRLNCTSVWASVYFDMLCSKYKQYQLAALACTLRWVPVKSRAWDLSPWRLFNVEVLSAQRINVKWYCLLGGKTWSFQLQLLGEAVVTENICKHQITQISCTIFLGLKKDSEVRISITQQRPQQSSIMLLQDFWINV